MRKVLCLFFCIAIFCFAKAQTIDTLIDVGSYKLHFTIIKGKGTPMLFEAGNGDDGTVWKDLLKPLYDSTAATLITYDRAGLGSSGIDTTTISFLNEVKGLETGLKKLGYFNKIFLVSHSFGGFYSSLFTYRNKAKVSGAVFIEVSTPCFFTAEWAKQFIDSIKADDWKMIKQYKLGLYYVLADFPAIADYMRDKYLTSATPATLIRAENILPIVKENEKEKWIHCLYTFGTMPNHRYVVAKDADHKVWDKNPKIVIDEIIKLYRQVAVANKE